MICDDCKFAGWARNGLVQCPILDRPTRPNDPCGVCRQGLLAVQRDWQKEIDRLKELSQKYSAHLQRFPYEHDLDEPWQDDIAEWDAYRLAVDELDELWELKHLAESTGFADIADKIRYFWSRTSAPEASCPACGYVRLDVEALYCPTDGTRLVALAKAG